MDVESKEKILLAIDQAMEHCQKAAGATNELAERDRFQELHQSLSGHRFHLATVQDDYPIDNDFVLEAKQRDALTFSRFNQKLLESVLTDSATKLSDADSIASFSDRVSQLSVRSVNSMKNPHELPDTPIDFRRYAKAVTSGEGWEDQVRYALDDEVRTRAIVFGGESLPDDSPSRPTKHLGAVLETGILAAQEAARNPNAPLSPDQDAALEAVVRLRERPALLVQKDNFPELPDCWRRLNQFRACIRRRIPCTGRIDWRPGEMVGTGFLVADDLVMTNRHVVEYFADPPPAPGGNWKIWARAKPTIDFKMEHGEPERSIFAIQSVAGVHPAQDIALLRVATQAAEPAGASLPAPVGLAGPGVSRGTDLYAVGYPYVDNENATPTEVIRAIFDDIFQVKRLQPGQFNSMFAEYGVFSHDCSTLGGNSGSGIVDVASNLIIGVHYKGKYRQANYAVAMWLLSGDDLFRDLNFLGAT